MSRLAKVLEENNTPTLSQEITGSAAASLIASSPYEPSDVVGFDLVEANRLGVNKGSLVTIAPSDTGMFKSIIVSEILRD